MKKDLKNQATIDVEKVNTNSCLENNLSTKFNMKDILFIPDYKYYYTEEYGAVFGE